jgi:hypothetical protein
LALLDEVRWFPGGPAVLAEARAEMSRTRKPGGAFAGLVALRANGIAVESQGEVAAAAGRSAAGVVEAVETFSSQRLRVIPASGEWTADRLGSLLAGLYELPGVVVIAQVAPGELNAQDTPDRAFRDYLDGGIPPLWTSRRRTGHFVVLGGTISGDAAAVVSVVDTNPSLGTRGVHLQTLDRLAAALRREKMSPGGLLLVVPAAAAERAAGTVVSAGLRPGIWD